MLVLIVETLGQGFVSRGRMATGSHTRILDRGLELRSEGMAVGYRRAMYGWARVGVSLVLLIFALADSYAELQNVQVGGEIRIRGRYWVDTYSNGVNGAATVRYPAFLLPLRDLGATGTNSRYDWSREGNDLSFVEQRSLLHVESGLHQSGERGNGLRVVWPVGQRLPLQLHYGSGRAECGRHDAADAELVYTGRPSWGISRNGSHRPSNP